MPLPRMIWRLLGLLIITAIAVTACQSATPDLPAPTAVEAMKPSVRGFDQTPLYGGTLTIPRNADPVTCNPAGKGATDITTSGIMGNVFESLTRFDANFEPQPELAESWEISDEGLTITSETT